MASILTHSKKFANLNDLAVGGNHIGDVGMTGLADALRCSTALQRLCVRDCQFSDPGATELSRALTASGASLRSLHFDYNEVRDEGATAMAIPLAKLESLEVLSGGENHIGNAGAIALAAAVGKALKLVTLVLAGNDIKATQEAQSISFFDPLPSNLITLDTSLNTFVALPRNFLIARPKLVNFWAGTGFSDPPQSIVDGGIAAMQTFCKLQFQPELATQNSICITHLKLGFHEARTLSDLLRCNRSMRELTLDSCCLGSAAGDAFLRLLVPSADVQADEPTEELELEEATRPMEIPSMKPNISLSAKASCLHFLRSLQLRSNSLGPENAENLRVLLSHCSVLTFLDLADNALGDDGMAVLAPQLALCATIVSLNLRSNAIHGRGGVACGGSLSTLTALSHLDVSFNDLGDEGLSAIGIALSRAKQMTKLSVSNNGAGADGAAAFADAIEAAGHLMELSWGSADEWNANSINPDACSRITRGLRDKISIRTLSFGHCSMGPEGAVKVSSNVSTPSLRALELQSNAIGNTGATAVAKALASAARLRTLILRDNAIGPSGADALSGLLRRVKELEVLDVSVGTIGIEGAMAVLEALRAATALKSLNLSANGIAASDISTSDRFFEAVPYSVQNLDVGGGNSFASLRFDFCLNRPSLLHADLGMGFVDPPQEIIDGGLAQVRDYLKKKSMDGEVTLEHVRVVAVGRMWTGKTSLIEALMSSEGTAAPIPFESRTQCMDVHDGDIGGLQCEVWDVSGNDNYRVAQRYFLPREAIYVLVIRPPVVSQFYVGPDSEDRLQIAVRVMVDDWMNEILVHAEAVAIVPVVTRCDDAIPKSLMDRFTASVKQQILRIADEFHARNEITNKEFRARKQVSFFWADGGNVHVVDCLTGTRVEELRQTIIRATDNLHIFHRAIPSAWIQIAAQARSWDGENPVLLSDFLRDLKVTLAHLTRGREFSSENLLEGVNFWEKDGALVLHGDFLFPNVSALIRVFAPLLCVDVARQVSPKSVATFVAQFSSSGTIPLPLLRVLLPNLTPSPSSRALLRFLQDSAIICQDLTPTSALQFSVPALIPSVSGLDLPSLFASSPQIRFVLPALPIGIQASIKCRAIAVARTNLARTHDLFITAFAGEDTTAPSGLAIISKPSQSVRQAGAIIMCARDSPPNVLVASDCRGMLRFLCGLVEEAIFDPLFPSLSVTAQVRVGTEWTDVVSDTKITALLEKRALMFQAMLSSASSPPLPFERWVRDAFPLGFDERVFFSFKWGHWEDDGGLIAALRDSLHSRTPTQVWHFFDVCPPPLDGVSVRGESRAGLSCADVAVLFLSRAYVTSPNCAFDARAVLKRAEGEGLSVVCVLADDIVRPDTPWATWGASSEDAQVVHSLLQRAAMVLDVADLAPHDGSPGVIDRPPLDKRLADAPAGASGSAARLVDAFVIDTAALVMASGRRKSALVSDVSEAAKAAGVRIPSDADVPLNVASTFFQMLDADGNGVVGRFELEEGLLELAFSPRDVAEILRGAQAIPSSEARHIARAVIARYPTAFEDESGGNKWGIHLKDRRRSVLAVFPPVFQVLEMSAGSKNAPAASNSCNLI